MKNLKKIVAVLISIMLVCNFVGCGIKTADSNHDINQITVFNDSRHNKAVMMELIDNFNKTTGMEKGIEIVYEVREGDLEQTIELAIASAQAPDIFSKGSLEKMASAGQIAALDDLPGGQELIDKYSNMLSVGNHIYKGKTYRLPYAVSLRGLIYNKEMFVKAGLVDENGEAKPPRTYEELRKYAKILTNEKERCYGIILPIKWSGWVGVDMIDSLMPNCGFHGYNPKTGRYDYSALVPILETYLGIKEDKSYYPGAEGIDNDPARSRFAEGKIGMKFGALWDVGVLTEQFPADFEWGVAPHPVINDNERYMNYKDVGYGPYISTQGINTKDPKKIMEVYSFLHGDVRATALYKNALDMPLNSEIVANTKVEVERKGWEDFGKILTISEVPHTRPNYDATNMQSIYDIVVNKVWSKKLTPQEAVKEYEDDINERVERYQEAHPDYDTDSFKDKNWEGHRN